MWSFFYVLCGAAKSTDAIITAYIVDVVPQRHRAGAMGINLAIAFGLSSALGNMSGTAVYQRWGTVPTFAVPVVLALLNVAYVVACLPESLKPEQRRTLHECSQCEGLAGLHPAAAFRLLRRDAPFFQSSGRIYMHRINSQMRGLALMDLFHVTLSMPMWMTIMLR